MTVGVGQWCSVAGAGVMVYPGHKIAVGAKFPGPFPSPAGWPMRGSPRAAWQHCLEGDKAGHAEGAEDGALVRAFAVAADGLIS